ncbi:MAG: HAD hydrolase-like protein, partial [Streptosporangiaceae bacterium]
MLRQPTEPAGPEPAASATSQTLQGVLFDMDGLLVDSEPIWFEAECAVMARLHGEWSAADQHALVGGSLSHTVSYLLARAERPASREEVGRWLVEGMTSLLMSRNLTMLPGARE